MTFVFPSLLISLRLLYQAAALPVAADWIGSACAAARLDLKQMAQDLGGRWCVVHTLAALYGCGGLHTADLLNCLQHVQQVACRLQTCDDDAPAARCS
jgi:hypothetical protein